MDVPAVVNITLTVLRRWEIFHIAPDNKFIWQIQSSSVPS